MLHFAPMPLVPPPPPEEPAPSRSVRRRGALSPSQVLGIIGAAFLVVGLLLPFEGRSAGLAIGALSDQGSASMEAMVIATMAALSVFLALKNCCPALALTAMIAQLAFASATLLTLGPFEVSTPNSAAAPQLAFAAEPVFAQEGEKKEEKKEGTGENLILHLATPPQVSPGPGWYVLLIGPLVLFVAAVLDDILAALAPQRRSYPILDCLPPLDSSSPDCV